MQSGRLRLRERVLELVSRWRQPVLDDRFHAALAEGAARLLVGEDVFQADDLLRQPGQLRLRRVDNGEPLVQFGEVIAGRARLALQPLADARPDRIEPLT